ncbi:SHOCT domain-containing protein [Natronomonas sp. CBA1123]|uniref:SHOCT domain-containing protein n=1 Tax=Natronomonas sp. CBA1123 TaxID=2668070 RepID=UPI0012EAB3ED|nr:SHOCT domain-containing protein [Natronomonas sp. CBA1123]MUV85277.1 SHOCT domain-containing protein [Natronomonas sp. CBA1123]
MSSSNRLDTTTIVLLIIGAIIALPLLTMGMGFGGMMGYGGMMEYGGTGGWWPFVGMLVPLIFLLILLGGGYLVFRRMSEAQASRDPAMEELRTAYARGNLTDEEFEARRDRLERSE